MNVGQALGEEPKSLLDLPDLNITLVLRMLDPGLSLFSLFSLFLLFISLFFFFFFLIELRPVLILF